MVQVIEPVYNKTVIFCNIVKVSIGEGNGNPLQCSCLENPRDGASWWAAVYEVTELNTTKHLAPERAMAPHSSILAWKIPWMEEPGRLQSMGSLRV